MNDRVTMADLAPIPEIVRAVTEGRARAADTLLPVLYDELCALARRRMAHEPPGHTLQPTALVHEAYLRLLGTDDGNERCWENKAHFFGAAALSMRRILVERARRQQADRHGGGRARLDLTGLDVADHETSIDLLALDEALHRLEAYDERKARIVTLRYFAGMTIEQTAKAIGIAPATVKTDWQFARAWLHRELADDGSDQGDSDDD